jgi:hypothetical protein
LAILGFSSRQLLSIDPMRMDVPPMEAQRKPQEFGSFYFSSGEHGIIQDTVPATDCRTIQTGAT